MLFQPVTDLNCTSVIRHASTHTLRLEQSGNVHRQTCFFTGNGSSSPAHLPTLRTTLQWQSPRKKFHLPGSVSQHGLCSTDLSRKLARYRSLPKSSTEQALPYGHTFQGGTQYAGRSQRETRLANLRRLYIDEELGLDIDNTVYALDATTIDLCLSVFPWAHFRQAKAAIKLHTLLDLRGNIPTFIHISDGKLHDVNVLDILIPEPGAYYVMDRGYLDYKRLHQLNQVAAFFVIRAKSNLQFRRIYSHPIDKSTGLRCDQTIKLTGFYPRQHYPNMLRRIKFYDVKTDKKFVFLTNNFSLPALTITELYRHRWQVELFFKWIKQHLRIKSFFGTSENAVKTQVWIAVSVYVLVAIIKKRLGIKASLYSILQILSLTIFETMTLDQLLTGCDQNMKINNDDIQLNLFDNFSGH